MINLLMFFNSHSFVLESVINNPFLLKITHVPMQSVDCYYKMPLYKLRGKRVRGIHLQKVRNMIVQLAVSMAW